MKYLIGCSGNDEQVLKFSKYLSYILRHNPQDLDLEMDKQGWVSVPELLSNLKEKDKYIIDINVLEEVVNTDNKGRYSLSTDKKKIRANQGHSIQGLQMDWKEYKPNGVLYHGTATRFVDSIFDMGLVPMSRQYVHLSKDFNTANAVGSRHGLPIILNIDAVKMVEDGFKFYESDNGVILVEKVPVKYISIKS